MEYPIVLFQIETTEGYDWMAEFPDVDGCVGGGDTPEEALKEALENLAFHLESLEELGLPMPAVSNYSSDYSGKMQFRTSQTIHRRLAELSRREKVTINQIINEAVVSRLSNTEQLENFKKALDIVNNTKK